MYPMGILVSHSGFRAAGHPLTPGLQGVFIRFRTFIAEPEHFAILLRQAPVFEDWLCTLVSRLLP